MRNPDPHEARCVSERSLAFADDFLQVSSLLRLFALLADLVAVVPATPCLAVVNDGTDDARSIRTECPACGVRAREQWGRGRRVEHDSQPIKIGGLAEERNE